jgi:hypothetical protein
MHQKQMCFKIMSSINYIKKIRDGRRRFFLAFALASAKPKIEREEKRARKKAKVPSAKEKRANSRFFLPPQWKSGFRAQSRSAGGKQGS